MQLPGILDELFSYTGPLGAVFDTEAVSLYLWAPTAQEVRALIYKSPSEADPVEIVQLKELNGVWSVKGPRHWEGCYYVYEVSVYHPSTLRIEKCVSNDPYARGLSADGKRTLLVNLDSDDVKPEGWDNLQDEKPNLLSFSDISLYELHVRDFSANDPTVPHEFQGGYLAFTLQDSAGVKHLKRLSSAGITHVHLLPTFQFAGVEDEKHKWKHISRSSTLFHQILRSNRLLSQPSKIKMGIIGGEILCLEFQFVSKLILVSWTSVLKIENIGCLRKGIILFFGEFQREATLVMQMVLVVLLSFGKWYRLFQVTI